MTTAIATQAKPATQLDVFKNLGLAPSVHSDAEFEQMAAAFGFLPRLTQFTDASPAVKKREIQGGFYLVSNKDDKVLLGDDVDVIPCAWRFKALETIPGQKPRSTTDRTSELFKEIASKSGLQNSHCQAGIEYLVWVPAAAKFATYLMGSKTALNEAAKLKPLIGCVATIKTHTYENPKNVWQGPKVLESSMPPASVPEPEALKEQIEKFSVIVEEKGEDQEKVEDSAKPARKR